MRPSEHGSGVGVGEGFPDCSVTGVGLPNLLSFSVCELARGDVLAGRFQIEALIGNGGSGRVLRAFDRESRMLVALKILRQELAGEAVWAERFTRELRVGRAISHPNVCRVFDIGDADGHKFLSLELATRGSLRNDVPKNDGRPGLPLPSRAWQERAADARAIVEGVCALHTAGIVHRDLKPENILRMEDGRLVVTDFGLATDPGSGPGTTIMVGTPSYMAPEVVMGDPATARSDVWGLGVVLHEVFFGVRPRWKVLGRGYRRYVRPEDITTDFERAVADLCGRCADDAPEFRPASAIEVLSELNRALLGKKVVARHVRRRMVWTATAVATVAALVLVKARFTNQAEASSAQVAAGVAGQVLQPTGTPADWSKRSTKLASFAGHLHCSALVEGGKKIRVIWGLPRRAENIDVMTGTRTSANLLPESYQDGCPALSPDGKTLLFEKTSDTGTHIYLSSSPTGSRAKELVRGSAPEWLPNGQEFAMEFDSRHAAIFSIPTGEMTLIGDDANPSRQISEKIIDGTGQRIAVHYYSETLDNFVVVQKVPSLNVVDRILVPPSTTRIRFAPGEGGLFAAMNGSSHGLEIVSIDLRERHLNRIGSIPGTDVLEVIPDGAERLIVSSNYQRDLWQGEARLTNDGRSEQGSLSRLGDLVIQRRLSEGKIVNVLRRADGIETQITDGPFDMGPTFFPDGSAWLYAKYNTHQIMKCEVSSKSCLPVLTDSSTPLWQAVDPTGNFVAYVSLMNIPRLHVLTLKDGVKRDLGPVAFDCPPIWSSNERLWVIQSKGARQVWVEVDVPTGERTGKEITPTSPPDLVCDPPTELFPPTADSRGRVSVRSSEISYLDRVATQNP